jgi:small nuclear ribonucleoprotein B and B'
MPPPPGSGVPVYGPPRPGMPPPPNAPNQQQQQ